MTNQPRYILLLAALLLGFATLSLAAQSKGVKNKTDDDSKTIKLVGFPHGIIQQLPTHYVVQTFQRWVLLENGSVEKIPSTSVLDGDEGYVNPTSITDLWWPVDLPKIQIRPTLDIVVQHGGEPKYIASGVDVRVPTSDKDWRNHGMNSRPLAKQWAVFDKVNEPNFRVEVIIEMPKDDDAVGAGEEEQTCSADDQTCTAKTEINLRHFPSSSEETKAALAKFGVLLANLDASSPLSSGFHIISIPIREAWIDLPVLETVIDKPYMLFCFGTTLPDTRALLNTKPEAAAMAGTSILAVEVNPTAPGGESPALADAYRPLYHGQN